jgi:HNH endonuclease
MFDYGVVHLIEGPGIDRPFNALTLTHDLHRLFGNFEVFFEPVPQTPDTPPHTYRIDSTRSGIMRNPFFPVTRTLFLSTTRTIDPPSARLLAVHSAITHILHLSAAGSYIDRILDHLDKVNIKTDGSTDLGRYIQWRLGVWDEEQLSLVNDVPA